MGQRSSVHCGGSVSAWMTFGLLMGKNPEYSFVYFNTFCLLALLDIFFLIISVNYKL